MFFRLTYCHIKIHTLMWWIILCWMICVVAILGLNGLRIDSSNRITDDQETTEPFEHLDIFQGDQ